MKLIKSQLKTAGLASLLIFAFACNSYVPTEDFLNSKVSTPNGMNAFPFGLFSVKSLVAELKKTELSDGSFPRILGWSKNSNT